MITTIEVAAFGMTIALDVEYHRTPDERATDDCPGEDAATEIVTIWHSDDAHTPANVLDLDDIEMEQVEYALGEQLAADDEAAEDAAAEDAAEARAESAAEAAMDAAESGWL